MRKIYWVFGLMVVAALLTIAAAKNYPVTEFFVEKLWVSGSSQATHNFNSGGSTWTLSKKESSAGYLRTSGSGAATLQISTLIPGKTWLIENGNSDTLTVKMYGKTGGTIATTKHGFYVCGTADVLEVWEQS